jgi:phosphatidylserine decarboxylase
VFLPADTVPQVVQGQRSIAGETILGKVGGDAMLGITQ